MPSTRMHAPLPLWGHCIERFQGQPELLTPIGHSISLTRFDISRPQPLQPMLPAAFWAIYDGE